MGPSNTSYLSNIASFHFHYGRKDIFIINQTKPTNRRLCSPAQPDGMSKLSIYILEGQELIRQPGKIKGSQQRAEPLTQVITVEWDRIPTDPVW